MNQHSAWALMTLLIAALLPVASADEIMANPGEAPSFVNQATIAAPMAAVWSVWTTGEGYKALGVAQADIDLRIGGLIRSHYNAAGVLGDAETIQNRILAYEPQRMIAICIDRTPEDFPFKNAWKHTWTVITLAAKGANLTHVRIASMGFGTDSESVAMRKFFEVGNAETLDTLKAYFKSAAPGGRRNKP